PSRLSSGTYSGTVLLSYSGGQQTVTVVLSVSPITISVVPNPIQFQCQQGGTLPTPQVLSVSSSDNSPVTFAFTSTGPVRVTPGPGSQNLSVALASNACLTPGASSASITV